MTPGDFSIPKCRKKAERTLIAYYPAANGLENAMSDAIADLMHLLDTTPAGSEAIDSIVTHARKMYAEEIEGDL